MQEDVCGKGTFCGGSGSIKKQFLSSILNALRPECSRELSVGLILEKKKKKHELNCQLKNNGF